MRFILYSPVHFEAWDFRSCDRGIGGSETSHIQMASKLAERGHEVITYAPLPDDMPSGTEWKKTKWFRLEEVDWSLPGFWVLYRCPADIDRFIPERPDQVVTLLMQDWDYATQWSHDRVARVDRIIVLCHAHRRWLIQRQPQLASKMFVSRNGLRLDLVEETEAAGIPERNPRRIMFASSPDRGLYTALRIFERAKEFVPDLQFFATYGYNNIDKLIAKGAKKFQDDKDKTLALMEKTGATFLGRLTQQALYAEWLRTGLWVYCTTFAETGPLHGDTLVETLSGPVPIRDLVGRDPFPVYSCDAAGNLSVSTARDVTLKRKNAPVVRVTFKEGLGYADEPILELVLTPDHEVMLRDGTYKPAGELKADDRVKAFTRKPNGWGLGYDRIGVTGELAVPEHRFVAARKLGRELIDGEVVDHLDGNKANNHPDNLRVWPSQSEHAADHFKRMTADELGERREKLSEGVRAFQEKLTPEQLAELRGRAGNGLWARINALPPEERETFLRKRVEAISEDGWRRRGEATAKMNRERYAKAPWRDVNRMRELYVTQGMRPEEMAPILGCSWQNVYIWLKKHGITRDEPVCSNHVVVRVEDAGTADVYCMEADPDHNFVANGIFVHNCITGLEAMALGAVPIFSPIWAQAEHVTHGIPIAGDPTDDLTIARFAAEVARLAANEEGFALQEKIRAEMMPDIRSRWDWGQFAWKKPGENWEQAAEEEFAKKANRTTADLTFPPADNPDERASRDKYLHLAPGSVFIDVGSSDGSWSIPAAQAGATVYAIDSRAGDTRLPDEAERLGLVEKIQIFTSKVGDAVGDDCFTLDSLALEANLSRIDFIKIDVEGDELKVLRGAQALIRRYKPDLLIEVHTETVPGVKVYPGDVRDLIADLGVGYVFETNKLSHQGTGRWRVYAHVPEERRTPSSVDLPSPAVPRIADWSIDGLPLCDNPDEIAARARWLHLTPGDVMLDIGAADGRWALEAVKQGATAHAFDPSPTTWLKKLAEDEPRITPHRRYVGNEWYRLAIDSLQLDRVDFVKIDVEGDELGVLKSMEKTLRRYRPRLMVEVHVETVAPERRVQVADVLRFLDELGLGYRSEAVMVGPPGQTYAHLFCWSPFRDRPKLSVVTASIRPEGLPMVADCLDRQTFRDFEWIVVTPERCAAEFDGPDLGCTVLTDPPKRPGDFYRLNAAWNKAIARARGDLILFVCDWTWFDKGAVEHVWRHHLANPNVGITSIGGQYRGVGTDGVPCDKWQDDPRPGIFAAMKDKPQADPMWQVREGLPPILWEQAFAAIGRKRLIEVGGFAEDEYDRVNANSEKELAMRLYANGYRFVMDESLEVKNYTHERMAPPPEIAIRVA